MELKIKKLRLYAGKPVCMIHEDTAKSMSLHVGNRVSIKKNKKELISVVDTVQGIIRRNEIGVSEEILLFLSVKDKDFVNVTLSERPHSIELIKKKLNGSKLTRQEIREIIFNIANNSLTEVEVAFFITAVYVKDMDIDETTYLIEAMVDSGNKINLPGKIVDKHSIGGVAGNRTTPIIVSICAAAGLIMPKTSSRAITSAAGTADSIETMAKVDFSIPDIEKIIKKTNACFVWGGALGLAPVDDKIIKIEKIANIDSTPQLLASILSKKISVGSKYILIDIPCGNSAKVSNNEAKELAKKFLLLGKKFGLKIEVIKTDGSEPIGNGIGPALEMKDVISVLSRDKSCPKDLEEKSLGLAGKILELAEVVNKGSGKKLAIEILESKKAYKKFEEILHAQKGKIIALPYAKFSKDIYAKKDLIIKHIDNKIANQLARIAGCPEDKFAGVYLHKKKGDRVKKQDKLFTIYSESKEKLEHANRYCNLWIKKMVI
ncbi:MAG: AMP phosphorylase [Nanoarchaeota archaeon]|nr:AMP phosphorylase [Nanoarchaeota archaeon]